MNSKSNSCLLILFCLFTSLSRGDVDYQKCVLNMSDCDDPDKIFYKVDHVFKDVHSDGIIGIIHRCTLGVDSSDVDFIDCKKAAKRENLLWGAYHFGKQGEDPIRQADAFIATLMKSHNSESEKVLIVLDEEYFHPKVGPVRFMSPKDAAAFVRRIHDRTGVYPGLYTGRDFLKEQLSRDHFEGQKDVWAILNHCWLWVAKYASQPPESDPWKEWSLWQYTGDGLGAHLPNLPEKLPSLALKEAELNIFSGSSDDARSFWNDHSWDYKLRTSSSSTSN